MQAGKQALRCARDDEDKEMAVVEASIGSDITRRSVTV